MTRRDTAETTWHRVAVGGAMIAAGFAAAVMLLPYPVVSWAFPILRTLGLIILLFAVVVGLVAALVIAYGPVSDELKFTALTDRDRRTTDDR